jgi:hypothetical protein
MNKVEKLTYNIYCIQPSAEAPLMYKKINEIVDAVNLIIEEINLRNDRKTT